MVEQEIFSNSSQVLMSAPRTGLSSRKLSAQAVESFKRIWVEAVSDIPLPSWCEPTKLADYLSAETEAYYIEKRLADRYERILKESKNIGVAFISYSEAMEDYSKAMMSVIQEEITKRPRSFYRSDFPLSLLTKLDLLKHTQIQAYDCLWKHLNSFTGKAWMYRGDVIKFRIHVTVPSNPTSKLLVDAYNTADKASSSLLAYVRIWNVSSYEELFKDKPLSKANLDRRIFSQLYQIFDAKLYDLRNVLLRIAPNTYSTPSALSPATRMLGEIMLSGRSTASSDA